MAIYKESEQRLTSDQIALLTINLLLFAGGALAHSGIPIPLGFGTWVEPLLVPAAIIEGAGAIGLAATLFGAASRKTWAAPLAWWVLWYCFAAVLWGMGRLALGSIPEARTITNDFLHIAMTLVTTITLVRIARTSSSNRIAVEKSDQAQRAEVPRVPGQTE